ncbi:MAG: TetR/AcrR family transcriptional regulator [Bacteroidales bacterium]|nr:TetR/AcrR family transcriptional regulator [Bacteroidales bacterium]
MTEQEKSTEETIFNAAKEEFIEKGFDGTRMQEIAKRAGINKALLHYYYRTKEKLFDAIFERVFKSFMPRIFEVMQSDAPIFYKIEVFVHSYLTLILDNPHIPSFVLHELNRNPERLTGLFGTIVGVMKDKGFAKFSETIKKEVNDGNIIPIEPEQLIVNIIALCIFPVVARPIIQGVIFDNDKKRYADFLESRKVAVTKFIINSISLKDNQDIKN